MPFPYSEEEQPGTSLRDVAAFIVLAPEGREPQVLERDETLRSVLNQDRPPRLIVLVDTTDDQSDTDIHDISADVLGDYLGKLAEPPAWVGIDAPQIWWAPAPGSARFGIAVQAAFDQVDDSQKCQWLWLLHDDMVATPTALSALLAAAPTGGTVAAVGPKQVRYGKPQQLLEVGIDATATARRVFLVEPDEIDQGQHNQREDVLAVGSGGMLVRTDVWQEVEGLDPALGPFGDGLEFGRRLWRAGYRVVVAPTAVVEHAQASYRHETGGKASYSARRAAQMYNWAVALPSWQFAAFMVWAPILSVLRAAARLLSRNPSLAFGEIAAYLKLVKMSPALQAARHRVQRVARVPRRALAPLESQGSQIARIRRTNRKILARGTDTRLAIDDAAATTLRVHRLRALAAFLTLVGVAGLLALFVWHPYRTGIQGGDWGALPTNWNILASQAWSGWQPTGDGLDGPANPLLVILAIASAPFSLLGLSPLAFGNVLAFLALPLAAASGWGVASSLTRSTAVRVGAGALWAASGALLLPLVWGNLAAIVVFLALSVTTTGLLRGLRPPAVLIAHGVEDLVAVPARNTVVWLAVAGLGATAAVAAAPLMLIVLPLAASLLALDTKSWDAVLDFPGMQRPRGMRRLAAILAVSVPGLAVILPTLVAQITRGNLSQFFAWISAPALGQSDVFIAAGLPAAVPTAEWGSGVAQAALAGQFQPVVLLVGVLAGVFLTLWAAAAVVVSVARNLPAAGLTIASWLLGAGLIGLASLQALLPGDAGSVSTALVAAASLSFVVAISASYSTYSLWAPQLLTKPDKTRSGVAVGVTAALASALSVVAILVLGPTGTLSFPTPEVPSVGEADASPLLEEDTPAAMYPVVLPQSTPFIRPAPSPPIPVIAQESQVGPRATRLLTLDYSDGTVRATLLRGPGVQLLDLQVPPTAMVEDVPARDVATADLIQAVATLTAQPSASAAQTLADHAVEVVLLSSESQDFEPISNTLSATPGLELIGNFQGSTMWRVRPDERAPARLSLALETSEETKPALLPLDSGPVEVQTHIDQDEGGTLLLAEVASPHWQATLDGVHLESVPDTFTTGQWRQAFTLPPGGGELRIHYSSPYLLPWWIATGVILSVVALMAVPRRFSRRSLIPRLVPQETDTKADLDFEVVFVADPTDLGQEAAQDE